MTNTKHTPGLWSVKQSTIVADANGTTVADCLPPWVIDTVDTRDEHRANAQLCAAAPDLLAALDRLVLWADDEYGEPIPVSVMRQARTAIAKAKGGE